jgi:hypothetical protein
MMQRRDQHRQQVVAFLQDHLGGHHWELTLPSSGRGQETYIAQSNGDRYFIKVGAHIPRYQVMASLDLTPAMIVSGYLVDGTSILVQPYIQGRNSSWQDFRHFLPRIAAVVNKTHHSLALIEASVKGWIILPQARCRNRTESGEFMASELHSEWGAAAGRSDCPMFNRFLYKEHFTNSFV